jgi:hypothetical protein
MTRTILPLLAIAVATAGCARDGNGSVHGGADASPHAAVPDAAPDAAARNATGDTTLASGLVFTRADGTHVSFSPGARLFLWCGPWDGELIPIPALQILLVGPGEEDPGFFFKAVVSDVEVGTPQTFPISFIFDMPEGVVLFLADGDNELSSDQKEASGSLTFQAFTCDEGGTVEFTVDAVLGSELAGLPTVAVKGSFRGTVGKEPMP